MINNQCSDLFAEIFDSCDGGRERECMCGRTHFDIYNNCDWDIKDFDGIEIWNYMSNWADVRFL